jgi:hypothetical protein
MKKLTILFATLLTGALLICYHQPVYAAPTLTLSQTSNGTFVLQGNGFKNVGTFTVTVTYDTSSLANPRVAQGNLSSGALMAVNGESPGIVRIAGVNPSGMNGTGVLLTFEFDPIGSTPGKIVSITPSLRDVNGTPFPVETSITPENQPQTGENQQTAVSTAAPTDNAVNNAPATGGALPVQSSTTAVGGSGPLVWLGGVSMPSDTNTTAENKESKAPPAPTPAPRAEPSVPPSAEIASVATPASESVVAEKTVEPVVVILEGVLERFCDFRGERTIRAFLALFEQKEQRKFRQEPPIALADGTTTVKIFVALPEAGKKGPIFALTGAKMTALKTESGGWTVEVLPEAGGYKASLIVSTGATITEFPLTIAPRIDVDLDKSGNVTEKDFGLYLKASAAKKSVNSVRKDAGRQAYVDDYIFSANYLIARQKTSVPEMPVPSEMSAQSEKPREIRKLDQNL